MKKLDYLLLNINTIKILGDKIIDIELITNNSEKVSEKSMFVAIKGNNSDGHNYIDQAILNGAKCIVCQILPEKIVNSITYIIVKNSSCLLYTSPSPRDKRQSRMPSSA